MNDVMTAKREIEINLNWATENPLLFAKKVYQFHQETADMPNRYMDTSRKGFVTYSAWIE